MTIDSMAISGIHIHAPSPSKPRRPCGTCAQWSCFPALDDRWAWITFLPSTSVTRFNRSIMPGGLWDGSHTPLRTRWLLQRNSPLHTIGVIQPTQTLRCASRTTTLSRSAASRQTTMCMNSGCICMSCARFMGRLCSTESSYTSLKEAPTPSLAAPSCPWPWISNKTHRHCAFTEKRVSKNIH